MEVFRLNGCTALFKNRQNQLSFDPLHTDDVDLKTKIHIDSVLALLVEKNKKQTY